MCGLCCRFIKKDEEGKYYLSRKKCPNLVTFKNGKTFCRHYNNRFGRKLGGNYKCTLRVKTKFDYPNCPYNSGKEILKVEK